jgi:hypothetical protein
MHPMRLVAHRVPTLLCQDFVSACSGFSENTDAVQLVMLGLTGMLVTRNTTCCRL